ncbi:MAG: ACT domain-containing protein [Candidatus Aminicenantales bacterium]
MNLDLVLLPGLYAVCRLNPAADIPAWAAGGGFVSLTKTPQETSIVCPEGRVPTDVRSERGFRVLAVRGPLDFSLTGVLASMVGPLAQEGIGVFAVSTFDTDYLLIREDALARAVEILVRRGHKVIPEE